MNINYKEYKVLYTYAFIISLLFIIIKTDGLTQTLTKESILITFLLALFWCLISYIYILLYLLLYFPSIHHSSSVCVCIFCDKKSAKKWMWRMNFRYLH